MPVRCHVEHDGLGIVLSRIESMENAISLRCFFAEFGIGGAIAEPGGKDDFRLVLVGVSLEEFDATIAGSNIELI